MSGCNYNISICQILESERRIKLSNILRLYQSKDGNFQTSLKEFVKTFSVDAESEIDASLQPDLTPFSSILHQNFEFSPILEIRQAIAFIAG